MGSKNKQIYKCLSRVITMSIMVVGLSVVASVTGLSQQAYAATINVNTNDPTATGGPDCSIIDAFEAANTNQAYGGCAKGDSALTVDTIVFANGTYDFQLVETVVNANESVTLKGQSRAGVSFVNGRLLVNQYQSLEISDVSFVHFDVDVVWQGVDNGNSYSIHDVSLASSELCLRPYVSSQMNEVPLNASFENISGNVANDGGDGSTINILSEGDTYVRNVTMDGAGGNFRGADEFGENVRPQAIWHASKGNDRLYIRNSLIKNYPTVLKNDECFALQPWSVYMDNVLAKDITGTAIWNECGHVVINRSTFANVEGPLLRGGISAPGYNDGYTDIEIYSSTFDGIQGDQDCPSIICFRLYGNGENPKGANRIRIKQSTFSENNASALFAYGDGSLQDSGVLALGDDDFEEIILQNNAIGSDVDPQYLVANQVTVSGNMTTGQSSSGITQVGTLGLGPLQDNGGISGIGENGGGGNPLTMIPLVTSPLINGANGGVGIEEDQRGAARNQIQRYDIGAMEVTPAEFVAMGGVLLVDGVLVPGAPSTGGSSSLNTRGIIGMILVGVSIIAAMKLAHNLRKILL